jgi:hypothetical protein
MEERLGEVDLSQLTARGLIWQRLDSWHQLW